MFAKSCVWNPSLLKCFDSPDLQLSFSLVENKLIARGIQSLHLSAILHWRKWMLYVKASSVLHALVLTVPVIFTLFFLLQYSIYSSLFVASLTCTYTKWFSLFLWDLSVLHLPLYILVGKQVAVNFTGICIFQ